MKIKKILIKNFKNIKERIIDFQENVTLFVGPNGFGKTTIFDAIELSLTGKIRRIEESDYSDGRSSFSAPYFQNNPNENTFIELMLTNDEGNSLIVSSLYKSSMNTEGSNVPKFSFSKFQRRVRVGPGISFQSDEDFEGSSERDIQKDISQFLGYESEDYSLGDTFDLFNYIQQDETAYYLKQKEKDRKEQLNFLLNIGNYVNRKNRLERLRSTLSSTEKELRAKKGKLKNSPIKYNTLYSKLSLREDTDFAFNNKSIVFDDELSNESLNIYLSEIEKLQEFRDSFSPKDYFLRKQSEQFERDVLEDKDFICYLIIRKIFENQENIESIKQNHSLISNEKNYSYFLLKNYIEQLESLENDSRIFKRGKILKSLLDVEIDKLNIELIKNSLNGFVDWEFGKVWFEMFDSKLTNYKNKKEQLDDGTDSINKLLEIRSRLKEHSDDNHSECVFCGYDWIESKNLLLAYEETTNQLRKNLTNFEIEVSNLVEELNQLKMELQNQIQMEQEKLFVIPDDFLMAIRSISNYDFPESFSNLVVMNSEMTPMLVDENASLQKFEFLKKELISLLQEKQLIPNEVYDTFLRVVSKRVDFEKLLEKYSILDGESIREFGISFGLLPISLHKFEENKDGLLVFLEELRSQIVFDNSKSSDLQNLFDKYFESNEKTFEDCTIESINQKREYIINQFELQNLTMFHQIEKRLQIIEQTITYLQNRVRELNNNISSYQEQMIQKLKLPFYMYTAKILQNYQQGMGVLLTTQNNSNIRFIANSNSEQDVMYQLSSGQVAVISFAFTLALNTTFKISKEFKFLSIDDPIQDMDSMNVYALIDLIRHSLSDYQIIMSTHNDGSAMFIKYKFELFSDSEISNVELKNIKSILLLDDTSY
ncbi:AAA family ATPase [Streptococcus mitis]|uniref:Nuclease SbcCD subunit C n=1 Tax=Streptococcus mitis TaxID=28037 RepID=A0A428D036_STRMT|nr:AAA family ATPase [Streptococcus mitis]RSI85475.1 recombination protein F [Streptococcus mitis]RSI89354.1 recombination protein F [Streptococcus mitis]